MVAPARSEVSVTVDNRLADQIAKVLFDAGFCATSEVLVAQLWLVISTFQAKGVDKGEFMKNMNLLWDAASMAETKLAAVHETEHRKLVRDNGPIL